MAVISFAQKATPHSPSNTIEEGTNDLNNNNSNILSEQLAQRLQNRSKSGPKLAGTEEQFVFNSEKLAENLESGKDAPCFIPPRCPGNLSLDLTRQLREKYGAVNDDKNEECENPTQPETSPLPQHVQKIISPAQPCESNPSDPSKKNLSNANDALKSPKLLPSKCVGLNNQGNTCYMNAALQCMLHFLKPFLLSKEAKEHKHHLKNLCPLCEMTELANSYFFKPPHTSCAITPRRLAIRAQSLNKQFSFGRQADSHEFLRAMIDQMQQSLTGKRCDMKLEQKTTLFGQVGGYLINEIQCCSCKHITRSTDPFLDLSIDVPSHRSNFGSSRSLNDSLKHYFSKTQVLSNQKYKCEGCKRGVNITQQFSVGKAPSLLTLHLKRFIMMPNYGFGCNTTMEKNNSHLTYPEYLDMTPYLSGKDEENSNENTNCMYKLCGLIEHTGSSLKSGHYISKVRVDGGHGWHLFDDEAVTGQTLKQVLATRAYILFYKKLSTLETKSLSSKLFSSIKNDSGDHKNCLGSDIVLREKPQNLFEQVPRFRHNNTFSNNDSRSKSKQSTPSGRHHSKRMGFDRSTEGKKLNKFLKKSKFRKRRH